MEFKDYYRTLGVDKTATGKELKQAYRKLARKHHPDVNPGDSAAEGRFKEVTEAYEVLGDTDSRRKYDELGANWRLYDQTQSSGQGPGGGWPFTGGRWTVNVDGGSAGTGPHDPFGGEDPFSDFFHAFFAGQAPSHRTARSRRAPRNKGRDVEQGVVLTLQEAFRGVQRRVSINTRGQARSIEVRIPAGVGDGARIRISGEGEAGVGGAAAGDFFLRVRIAPHPHFRRKGRDLYATVEVPVTTVVLGGTVDVTTLEDTPLTLKIPHGTRGGQVFRLKGHGMPPVRKSTAPGDLYATVELTIPRDLTPVQRSHYEALADIDASVGQGSPRSGGRRQTT